MGYDTDELRIPLRLDNHLDERTWRDRSAAEELKEQIESLILSNPDYARIATIGVC